LSNTALEMRLNPFSEKLEVYEEGKWVTLAEEDFTDEDFRLLQQELAQQRQREEKNVVSSNDEYRAKKMKQKKFFDDKGTFQPVWLAKYISTSVNLLNDGQFLYRYENGVFKPDGESFIRKMAQKLLKNESRKNKIEETLYWLKNETVFDKELINLEQDEIINVSNGLLDWRTGELHEHKPVYKTTIQLPVEYNPTANEPAVMEFAKSIVPEDTVETVFEMIGYCLLPITKYEKAFMLTGTGANGKSTLINIFTALIGKQNIANISLQALEENRFRLAELDGKLLNTFADLPHSAINKSSNFKMIVSGDRLTAERKNKNPFEFTPFAKMIFSANEIPKSSDVTDGFFRRWIIIPFPNKFEGKKRDTKLIEKLITPLALSTLLNLAIEGLKRLEKNCGFTENETTRKMLQQYRKDTDSVGTFINECCVIEEIARFSIKDMYRAYELFCHANGYKAHNNSDFNKQLKEKSGLDDYKRIRLGGNLEYCWHGISLKGNL
jgi:putative DNA primase/helicase